MRFVTEIVQGKEQNSIALDRLNTLKAVLSSGGL
jgi:hypothetical protein